MAFVSVNVFFSIIDNNKNSNFSLLFFWWILEHFLLVNSRTLLGSRIFSKANVLCFLFYRSRHILLLDASTSRIKYATTSTIRDFEFLQRISPVEDMREIR